MTPDAVKSALADNERAAAGARGAGEHLVDQARQHRERLTARMAELAPKALSDEAADREYQALTEERGRLDITIGGG